jgi:hypothetical protein
MAKAKKITKVVAVRKPREPRDPEQVARVRRITLHLVCAIVFIGLCGVGLLLNRRYVEHKVVFAKQPPAVVLKNRPVWMSDFLAEQIVKTARPAGAHSAFDHQLLVDTVAMLRANPWIREVKQVRRAYRQQPGDTLEVDCEYRAPVALVKWQDYFWLVDGDGVKLPEVFSAGDVPHILKGQDNRMNIRVIEGVTHAPPETGAKWVGADLQAGLELVKLLFGRNYAEEVEKVDVSNFGGRQNLKTAHLVLVTRYNTQVRWGQPVTVPPNDFIVEVPAAQKLAFMQAIFEEKHRVDGNFEWVDIRFDVPNVPSTAQTAATTELHR